MPTSITVGSDEKMPINDAAAKKHRAVDTAITAAAMPAAMWNTAFTRSPSPAPKFWPAIGDAANASATTGMNDACSTRMPMP